MNFAELPGRLLYALAWIPGHLPLAMQRWLGALAGRLTHASNKREAKVARRNLELIAPDLTPAQREIRVGEILRATGSN